MKLADCEVMRAHVRGHNVVYIFGPHALSKREAAALLEQVAATWGPGQRVPGYCSPEGWQSLAAAAKAGPLERRFAFDEAANVVDVDGLKISGELFDHLGAPTPAGTWLRVTQVEGGVATVEQRTDLVDPKAAEQTSAPASSGAATAAAAA